MHKIVVILLATVAILGFSLAATHQAETPEAKAAAQIPSIRACTTSAEFMAITDFLTTMTDYLDEINRAAEAFDLEGLLDAALEMETYWYEESPDMPYCAQGVHTRLLIDRIVINYALAAYALNDLDTDRAERYTERGTAASRDLVTYGNILSGYQ
jgi:hypothetical protein